MKENITTDRVGNFNLTYSLNCSDLVVKFNNPPDNYGVAFIKDKWRIEVLECLLGTRILINSKDGDARDMPFCEGTFKFLPEYVKAERIV